MGCAQQVLSSFSGTGSSNVYATWNPSDKSANITLSGGNLVATGVGDGAARSTISKSAGKWYWEVTVTSAVSGLAVGAGNSSDILTASPGTTTNSIGYYPTGAIVKNNAVLATKAGLGAGVVVSFAYDAGLSTLQILRNNLLQFTASGVNIPTGALYAMCGFASGGVITANFGASPFAYTPPAGYNAGLYTE